MTFRLCWLLVIASAHLGSAEDAYESAAKKVALILEEKAAPGSRIRLSVKEINAYAAAEALKAVPQGLSQPRVELTRGGAVGHALVDFVKVRQSKGAPPNLLFAWLLAGEKPVRVAARIQSARGRATVNLDEVSLGGVPARGVVLDFLIENFLLPYYPNAVIGKPFDLKHRVERVEVAPSSVTILIK